MDSIEALFAALRSVADGESTRALAELVERGTDRQLARINALGFAAEHGLQEEATIAALLHAAQLGILEMSWNILCPSCSGVLDVNATLRGVRQENYHCALCAVAAEPILDDTVEVTFAVSPRVRRIAAHDPDKLDFWDYHRHVFFGSGLGLTADDAFRDRFGAVVAGSVHLRPGERVTLSLRVGPESIVLFDPVTHAAHFVTVEAESTGERQELAVVFSGLRGAVTRSHARSGVLEVTLDNRTDRRVLPGVLVYGRALQGLLADRRPFLTAKRLLTNQTFRDLYRTGTLAVEQRLKILNMTFLFTDLKGSTELYERVGDLVAYDLVRAHFSVLHDIVVSEGGAVVKTIGDAVMATFLTPQRALAAALRMRTDVKLLSEHGGSATLALKIGLHAGPCLAVNLNDRQDYFGQTVNIASRVQELATSDTIFATKAIVAGAEAERIVASNSAEMRWRERSLRGVSGLLSIFELT